MLSRELAEFEPAVIQSPAIVARMQLVAREIESAEQGEKLAKLSEAIARLAMLRNEFAHRLPDSQRPAYSLDEED